MQGIHDAESADGSSAPGPPDWPSPDAPLPGDEPTMELPEVTKALALTSTPSLAEAALTLALANAADNMSSGTVPGDPDPDAEFEAELADSEFAEDHGFTDADFADPEYALDHGFAEMEHDHGFTEPEYAEFSVVPGFPVRDHEPEDEEPAGPPPPGRRWLVGAAIAAVALVLTGATVVALTRGESVSAGTDGADWAPPAAVAESAAPEEGELAPGGAAPAPEAPGADDAVPGGAGNMVSAALDGRTEAGFDLVDGAKNVTLRTADLGDSLYQITTPEGSNAVPRAEDRDGRIELRLDGSAVSLDVALNSAVRWDLRVAGGAELSTIDLSTGRIGGVELSGGASQITLTLPPPDGTLSVRMAAGVNLFDVRTTGDAPVRVRLGSGAGQVILDGSRHSGVAAGRTFTPDSWGDTVDRVDVNASAGLSALTVAPTSG